jgi:hypothetical protein
MTVTSGGGKVCGGAAAIGTKWLQLLSLLLLQCCCCCYYTPWFGNTAVIVSATARVAAASTDHYNIAGTSLRVSIRHNTKRDAPSCQHSISQIELHNSVRILYVAKDVWMELNLMK